MSHVYNFFELRNFLHFNAAIMRHKLIDLLIAKVFKFSMRDLRNDVDSLIIVHC